MSCEALEHAASCVNPFANFEVEKVLSESDRTKYMALLGRWRGKPDKGIILLSRRPFDSTKVQDMLATSPSSELLFKNDIYAKYASMVAPEQATITVDTIYPATEKHISKHSTQKFIMVAETAEVYSNKVLPYMQSLPASRITWVYNILEKKAETERLLFEDPNPETGFMLHPDLKWDQTQTEGLYCIALCHRRDLKCLRDLTADSLPLLRNVKHKTCQVIQDKYGIQSGQIRAYIHYHPSYYHLHVHFMHLSVDAGAGMAAGKAHLLDDVIDNIEVFGSDYYKRRTLHFTVGESDPLYKQCFANIDEPQAKRTKQ
ncbi:hypothetical protein ABBQ38_015253 [Trebouxia sp. C0009 RCD-2024]